MQRSTHVAPRGSRGPVVHHDETCASCGSAENLERTARYGEIPFCRECLDRSFTLSEWDELGEAGA